MALPGLLIAAAMGIRTPHVVVNFNDSGNTKVATGVDCYANLRLSSDGDWYENSVAASDNFSTQIGTWLVSGLAANVWVERTITGGTPGTLNGHDAGAGRLQLNVDRDFGVVEVTTTETHTCVVTFDFYDAATFGRLLDSQSFGFSATENAP